MKLKEFEGKELLKELGIPVPQSTLLTQNNQNIGIGMEKGIVLKAQTLSGKRKEKGGILFPQSRIDVQSMLQELYGKEIEGEIVQEILVEEKITIAKEYYLSLSIDTRTRNVLLVFSSQGGSGVEDVKEFNSIHLNVLRGLPAYKAREMLVEWGIDGKEMLRLSSVLCKAYTLFRKRDMRLLEINPIIIDDEGNPIAGDCKVILDDDGIRRQKLPFELRTGDRKKTELELAANNIDEDNHKGVAGRSFVELDGDIAVLASGGGASLIAMDALINYGGKPANYTEYSGNPPKEKVKRLTEVTLSKPGLKGCWVVGGTANFTRIDDTLAGFLEALIEIRPTYPILVRRAGPGDKEAFAMLKDAAEKYNLDIHLYGQETPITLSAKYMAELVNGGDE
jgi:succinyl-CoA synthetase beta subunit